jgi:RHS repeat-associated protein
MRKNSTYSSRSYRQVRIHRWLNWAVITSLMFSLILSCLGSINLAAAASPAIASEVTPTPPTKIKATPPAEPHLPSLSLRLSFDQEQVALNETLSATFTITNEADYPATNLVVTLPTPAGAVALPGLGMITPDQGWQWTQLRLDAKTSLTLTASLKLTSVPPGEALLAQVKVTAKELSLPLQTESGLLVIDRTIEKATGDADFTPGATSILRSPDKKIEVKFPDRGHNADLKLHFKPKALKLDELKASGGLVPPQKIGRGKTGFGTFFLEANDKQNKEVKKFAAPLTITLHYTPQQLRALGINENDLSAFWFDEAYTSKRSDGTTQQGRWVALDTKIDPISMTASTTVDHFSSYTFSDGTAASAAYIPSLQGWQESLYTGAGSYSYPMEVPSGPGGIKPDLNLSYSSAAMDGATGQRRIQTSSWVGRGWSLDTPTIAHNESGDYNNLILNGQTYDLIRGAVVSNNADGSQTISWKSANEGFSRVYSREVVHHPEQTTWQVWAKNGTRYDFNDYAQWAWANYGVTCNPTCQRNGQGNYTDVNVYKYLVSKIVDTHGNTITYTYGRWDIIFDCPPGGSSCPPGHAIQLPGVTSVTLTPDIWPSIITWGGVNGDSATDRFKITFFSSTRANDNEYDEAHLPAYDEYAAPRNSRQLNNIEVSSRQNSTWELINRYVFSYDFSLLTDYIDATSGSWAPDTSKHRLTLKSIQKSDKNGALPLPATTFSYGQWVSGYDRYSPPGWNRLTQVNNGQGGVIDLIYENIGFLRSTLLFNNHQRIKQKNISDGQGHTYPWFYTYGTPGLNTLGTGLGDFGPDIDPNSAALYYNKFLNPGVDNTRYLAQKKDTEFRGHDYTIVKAPDGSYTKHYFIQGGAGCTPTTQGTALNTRTTWDSCYDQMLQLEFLKGKEWQVEYYDALNTRLRATTTSYSADFYDYGATPLSGVWHAFSHIGDTVDYIYEGIYILFSKSTHYDYDLANQGGVQYGNITKIVETDQNSAKYRTTERWYNVLNDSSNYIVDRVNREVVTDKQDKLLTIAHYFYDGSASAGTVGTKGDLTRVLKYYDVPLQAGLLNLSLHGTDTSYVYDIYGNRTEVRTYPQVGTATTNASGVWSWSAPGNDPGGTSARITKTDYDTTFHVYSIKTTSPSVNAQPGMFESAGYDFRMGLMTQIIDVNGQTTQATYDDFGRLATVTKPGDTMATMSATYYDTEQPFRYVVSQHDTATGYRVTTKFYNGIGQEIQTKTESIDPTTTSGQNIVVDTVYDGLGRVSKTSQPRYVNENGAPNGPFWKYTTPDTDPNMRWTITNYDGIGRPIITTSPVQSIKTQYQYGVVTGSSPLYHSTSTIDPNGHFTQQQSDEFGHLLRVDEYSGTYPSQTFSARTSYIYNNLDQLISVTDAVGNQTSIKYDSLGRKISMTDPDMGTWNYFYDANGNLRQQTDNKAQIINFKYDELNRLTSKLVPTGQTSLLTDNFDTKNTTNWTYTSQQTVPFNDAGNNVVKNVGTGTDWNASYYRNSYSLSSGKGLQVRFKFTTLPTAQAAVLAIENNDTTGRRFGINADTSKLYVQYMNDGVNLVYPATLISNLQTNTWYDLKIDLDDTNGFMVQTWQENTPSVRGSYTFPMATGKTWRFRQWNYGQTSYLDDYQEYSTTVDTNVYNYDETTVITGTVQYGKGLRTSMSNASATQRWQYDVQGRAIATQYSNVTGLFNSRLFETSYDSAGRVATMVLPSITDPGNPNATSREVLTYSYDAAWRPVSLCTNHTSFNACYVSGATYNALNQPLQEQLGNGLFQNWSYSTPLSRLITTTVGTTAGGSDRFNRSYTQYDNVGNLKQIVDTVPTGQPNAGTQTLNFSFDHLDRLITATATIRGTDPGYGEGYGYDLIGNITSKAGVSYIYPAAGSPRPHTPTSVGGQSYIYDNNGNLTSGGGRDVTNWSAENKPLAIIPHTGGLFQGETYYYDADGVRISKGVAGVNTEYLGGWWEEEYNGASGKVNRAHYQFGGQVVAIREKVGSAVNTVVFLHNDSLGSASVVTAYDKSIIGRQEFDPWGKVRANAGTGTVTQTKLNYTDQHLDGTGLLYYNARYYDPGIGKFISPDTVVPGKKELRPLTVDFHEIDFVNGLNEENFFTQEKGFWFNLSSKEKEKGKTPWGPIIPQTLNRYAYASNNPILKTDPNGHDDDDIVWRWSNKYYRVIMRKVENHDGTGWHFNLEIQNAAGGADLHNLHVKYHGLLLNPRDGKMYYVFSYTDSVDPSDPTYNGTIAVLYGKNVDPAFVAGGMFATLMAAFMGDPGLEWALFNGNNGNDINIFQQFQKLMDHDPEPIPNIDWDNVKKDVPPQSNNGVVRHSF